VGRALHVFVGVETTTAVKIQLVWNVYEAITADGGRFLQAQSQSLTVLDQADALGKIKAMFESIGKACEEHCQRPVKTANALLTTGAVAPHNAMNHSKPTGKSPINGTINDEQSPAESTQQGADHNQDPIPSSDNNHNHHGDHSNNIVLR
jgi:hypothetical protein